MISPSCKLWVVVSAAETFVITVVVTLSTFPVTCVWFEVKLYKPDEIPVLLPLE